MNQAAWRTPERLTLLKQIYATSSMEKLRQLLAPLSPIPLPASDQTLRTWANQHGLFKHTRQIDNPGSTHQRRKSLIDTTLSNRVPKQRRCLRCGKMFNSRWAGNRICCGEDD